MAVFFWFMTLRHACLSENNRTFLTFCSQQRRPFGGGSEDNFLFLKRAALNVFSWGWWVDRSKQQCNYMSAGNCPFHIFHSTWKRDTNNIPIMGRVCILLYFVFNMDSPTLKKREKENKTKPFLSMESWLCG